MFNRFSSHQTPKNSGVFKALTPRGPRGSPDDLGSCPKGSGAFTKQSHQVVFFLSRSLFSGHSCYVITGNRIY